MSTTHRNGEAAARAYAKMAGITGRGGGWLYRPNGTPVCQGWQSLVGMLVRHGIIVDTDGAKLGTLSPNPGLARTAPNDAMRELYLRRNVFDRKPVQLALGWLSRSDENHYHAQEGIKS